VNVNCATASFRALGTSASVSVTAARALPAALEIVEHELRAIDETCSRFRPDSELSLLNRRAGRPFAGTPLLLEAIGVALEAAARSDGDVDPTVGRSLRALGWDSDFSVVVARPGGSPRMRIVAAAGWQRVRLDRANGTVRIPAGVEIDLGSTAKALAADRCARSVHDETGASALVSLGGDIALAGPAPGGGWPILVTDDHRSRVTTGGQTIALAGGGLATSSTVVRRWRAGDDEVHHIVDPRSGAPAAEVWRTVSVAAGTCVEANVASTAAIVRGERAVAWLERCGLPARLVRRDGSVERTCGWPSQAAA
jgi:FAD:protein FMN transferase